MAECTLIPVVDEGLGNSTYLLEVGSGQALVIDPERDLRPVRAQARKHGLRIAWAVETHMHADFISGVRELAAVDGAKVLAPEVGERGFAAQGLTDGDTVQVGRFRLQALHTPGHSPEHLSYLLRDDEELLGVFTGGSLMVGTAGRTDLVSPERTVPLARAQYHSLQRLMELPDETPVWPTHGAGSFCSAASGDRRVSTIGLERDTNPLLQVDGEDAFVQALLGSMGTFPDYFLELGAINHDGPAVLGGITPLEPLPVARVQNLITDGAQIVDVRSAADFAAGHIPGALSITLRPVFSTWLGWLATPDRPVVIVRSDGQSSDDIVAGAANVGFDTLAGELDGGMNAWTASGGPVLESPLARGDDVTAAGRTILDVRQASEFAAGHAPRAVNVELGTLSARLDDVPAGPLLVMCGHGERAMGAASVLERGGRTDVQVLDGGPDEWSAATGRALQAGS
ncbi:MBL fold metallo-hydrolase [Rhodococcus yananensis]|uniref:MBL fold metallo-hydrolase n=1 Tax=Rhodococcus yananensis TaxID=2879464 RepID=UPI003EB88D43